MGIFTRDGDWDIDFFSCKDETRDKSENLIAGLGKASCCKNLEKRCLHIESPWRQEVYEVDTESYFR